MKRIDSELELYGFVENLFFGLSLGSVLVLAAIGLAITFGVMGVINMAHGELIMIGAYTTYVMQLLMPDHIGASVAVRGHTRGLSGFGSGRRMAIERGVIRFPLRPLPGDAAGHVRHQPDIAADGAYASSRRSTARWRHRHG